MVSGLAIHAVLILTPTGDASKLAKQLNIIVKNCVELSRYHDSVILRMHWEKIRQAPPRSLQVLAETVLGLHVSKEYQQSKWSGVLRLAQIRCESN